MIKVYLDWNVMANMKDGFQKELLNILSNKDKFFIPYSTSHIGDIFASYSEDEIQKERINNDLKFITSLTNNQCLFNNGKKIISDYYDPNYLFEQRVDEKDLFKDLSINGLKNLINDSDNVLAKSISNTLFDSLKSIELDFVFKQALENPETNEMLNVMFPDLKHNPTMEGFFDSFSKMVQNFNDKEDYKDVRKIMQKSLGITRDKIFNDNNPYSIIDNAHDKLKLSLDEYIDNTKNAPEWFNKISNEYLMLDMHGYQEDTVRVKNNKRKETFKNTTEDSFHTAFASTCNFYIINDKKSYNKTKKIYERLGISTKVFKPNEFIDYYNKYLNFNNGIGQINLVFELIKSKDFIEDKDEMGILRTYYFPFFIFDFFNKILVLQKIDNEYPIVLLSKFSLANGNISYFIEIEKLIEKFIHSFGKDIENIGDLKEKELIDNNFSERKWRIENLELSLTSVNGYIQLYFN